MIWLTCPQCQVKFPLREAEANRAIDCPRCRSSVPAPEPVVEPQDEVEPADDAEAAVNTPPPTKRPAPRPPTPRRNPAPSPGPEPAVDRAFPNGVPPRVAALGALLFSIRVESLARPVFNILGLVLMVLALLLFIPGVVSLIPQVQAQLAGLAALFILGLGASFVTFVLGLVIWLVTRVNNDWTCLFFDDGFVVVQTERHQVWRYRDIRGLYTERIDRRTYMYGWK